MLPGMGSRLFAIFLGLIKVESLRIFERVTSVLYIRLPLCGLTPKFKYKWLMTQDGANSNSISLIAKMSKIFLFGHRVSLLP